MAVDPKQVLQKNIPLVLCYVAGIVPVVLWFVVVVKGVEGGPKDSFNYWRLQLRSKKAALEKIARDITAKDPSNPVYTPDHKKKFSERNDELKNQYDNMIKLIEARDNALESWLPAIADQAKDGKLPGENPFQTALNTAMDGLKKEYKDIVIDPSPTATAYIQLDLVSSGAQKKLQKQFWILDRVLSALKKGGTPTTADPVPIRLISAVEFEPIPQVNAQPGPNGQMPPPPLMAAIPFKLTLQMGMPDVPKVLRELLAQDIVFRLKGLHVELLPFSFTRNDLGLTINADPKPLYEQTIYNATLAGADKKPADEALVLPEPKVKVTIELEAIDFDMAAVQPAPAAPPPEKAEEPPPPPPKKNNKKKKEEGK